MIQYLYLDIDGVLNRHDRHENGYSTMHPECLEPMNYLLRELPDMQLVVSSAWRYQVLNGHMTLKGLECLLLTHGLDCFGRIAGITCGDEAATEGEFTRKTTSPEYWEWLAQHGHTVRARQIQQHVQEACANAFGQLAYAVVDDLDLPLKRLVKTEPNQGLTYEHVQQLQYWLTVPADASI